MSTIRIGSVGKGLIAAALMTTCLSSGCSQSEGWNETAQRADPEGYILHLERLLRRDREALRLLQRDLEAAIHDAPSASSGDAERQASPAQQVQSKGMPEPNAPQRQQQQQADPKAEAALKSVRSLLTEIEDTLKELDAQRQVVKDRLNSVPSAKIVGRARDVLARAQRLLDEDPMRAVRHPRKAPPETK